MSAFITRLIDMSLAGGILILLAVILRLVFRRAPKRVALMLWAVVALRLLCPVFINGGFVVMPRVDDIAGKLAVNGEPTGSEPAFETALPTKAAPIGSVEATGSAITPAQTSSAEHPSVTTLPTSTAVPIVPAVKTEPAPLPTQKASVPAAARTGSWQKAAFFVWLAGAVCMFCYAMISFARLKSRLSTAIRLRDNVYQSEYVSSPFLLGVLHPRIYVPFGLEGESLEYALAHERAHISRCDHIVKPIGFAVLSLHWFNPLCWLAYALFCRDIELACDERVTASFTDAERAGYSNALLDLSSGKAAVSACPLTFGEGNTAFRIKRVLSHKKPLVWLVPFCLLICLLLVGCSLFGGKSDPPSGGPAPTETAAADPTEEPTAKPTEEIDRFLKAAEMHRWVYVNSEYKMEAGEEQWNEFMKEVEEGNNANIAVLSVFPAAAEKKRSSDASKNVVARLMSINFNAYGFNVEGIDLDASFGADGNYQTNGALKPLDRSFQYVEMFYVTEKAYMQEQGVYHLYALTNGYISHSGNMTVKTPYDLPTSVFPLFLVKAPDQAVIQFADPGFETCVRQQLGLPEGAPVSYADVSGMDALQLSGDEISSLEDMYQFKYVNRLFISNAPNIDPGELAGFTWLKELSVTGCELDDLSFVSSLTWLERLSFDGPGITDLSPVWELGKLTSLDIGSCNAADLKGINSLKLNSLSVSSMPNTDVTAIYLLKPLTHLTVFDCGLTDIDFVARLYKLEYLCINNNKVSDISLLSDLTMLAEFHACDNMISDISPLLQLRQLHSVDLSWNPVDRSLIDELWSRLKGDKRLELYPYYPDQLACWPVDLDGDGEDEYFYADLGLMQNDFISFVWLENKDHYRLSEQFYCGTGNVAFGSFALVESPEYGRCIMSTTSLNYGIYGYSLMTLVDGRLQTVYSETFYNSDDDNAHFDPEAAAEYEERINTLYASGQLLVTTDRWNGLMRQEFLPDGKTVDIEYNDTLAVICAYGSTGTGIDNVRAGENASHFVIFDRRNYSRVTVKPFTGE